MFTDLSIPCFKPHCGQNHPCWQAVINLYRHTTSQQPVTWQQWEHSEARLAAKNPVSTLFTAFCDTDTSYSDCQNRTAQMSRTSVVTPQTVNPCNCIFRSYEGKEWPTIAYTKLKSTRVGSSGDEGGVFTGIACQRHWHLSNPEPGKASKQPCLEPGQYFQQNTKYACNSLQHPVGAQYTFLLFFLSFLSSSQTSFFKVNRFSLSIPLFPEQRGPRDNQQQQDEKRLLNC